MTLRLEAYVLGEQDDFHWHELAYVKIQGREFKEKNFCRNGKPSF